MVELRSLPFQKIIAAIVLAFFIFFFFNNQFLYERIEKVEGCDSLLDPNKVDPCKKEISGCLALPGDEQRSACITGAEINRSVLPFTLRLGLFFLGLLLIVFRWGFC